MVGCRAKQVEPLQLCRTTHRVLVQRTCKVVGYFSRPTGPHCPSPHEDVAHFLFQCPHYNTLRTRFADIFPPSISTTAAWLAQPACARIAQFLSQCYTHHSNALLPHPVP